MSTELKSYQDMEYYSVVEKLSDILMIKVRANDPLFFRVMVSYYLTKVSSMMRCSIVTVDRGIIPVNMYAFNLANSGVGKGFSTSIMENNVINQFLEEFTEKTLPIVATNNMELLALRRATKKNTEVGDEVKAIHAEYANQGTLLSSFDSGTSPALKQMRHKLLLAGAGSLNLEIDEIGTNLLNNTEMLGTYLELFDLGKVKTKLIKHTNESNRYEEIIGQTPTNMMLFGTPAKLLNNSKTEEEFNSMLETGYARRCIFGYNKNYKRTHVKDANQVYDDMSNPENAEYISKLSNYLKKLANPKYFNKQLQMDKDVALIFIQYRLDCEIISESFNNHQEVEKSEMDHRYFKAMKLAGAYAFIEESAFILEKHAYNAIKLIEDSGKAFHTILNRDKPYVKFAKYLANIEGEVTIADIMEDLPFVKGSEVARKDLIKTATAWGCTHNISIKCNEVDGVCFYSADALEETTDDNLIISYSNRVTEGYNNKTVKWNELHTLVEHPGLHWVTHHLNEKGI